MWPPKRGRSGRETARPRRRRCRRLDKTLSQPPRRPLDDRSQPRIHVELGAGEGADHRSCGGGGARRLPDRLRPRPVFLCTAAALPAPRGPWLPLPPSSGVLKRLLLGIIVSVRFVLVGFVFLSNTNLFTI